MFSHIMVGSSDIARSKRRPTSSSRVVSVGTAAALPQNGLIVDVRDNGGGHIYASEFTLQTMTPRHISPEPVQFISTPLNLRICRRHKDNPAGIDLGPWLDSLDLATETGAAYSAAKPITPEDGANDLGQTYYGPVVLITDARCYSATDIFAAGSADHDLRPVFFQYRMRNYFKEFRCVDRHRVFAGEL